MSEPLSSSSPAHTAPASARERLLDAAAEVFARDGLRSATTREIAQAAGVNEVTLFRLFQSKQNLLAAVLERVFAEPVDSPVQNAEAAIAGKGLEEIVGEYVARYSARVSKNHLLLRVLIGEIQHFQEHEMRVIHAIFLPERQKIIDGLCAAQKSGLMRKDADCAIVADQLSALVFMGEMRRALPLPREYSGKSYLEACVASIARAIEAPTSKATPRPRPARPARAAKQRKP